MAICTSFCLVPFVSSWHTFPDSSKDRQGAYKKSSLCMQPLPTVTLVPKVKMNSWTSNALVLLLLHCVRQEGNFHYVQFIDAPSCKPNMCMILLIAGVSASFTRCHLQRGFSVAEIHPWDSNSTLGCEVKAEDVDAEYHYFSSYKSSSENKTITILLTRGDRQPKSDLRLMLCSYEQVSWRVAADNPVTLKVLRVVSCIRSNIYF